MADCKTIMVFVLFLMFNVTYLNAYHESGLQNRFQCHNSLHYNARIRFKITFRSRIITCTYSEYLSDEGYKYTGSGYECIPHWSWTLLEYEEIVDMDQPNCDVIDNDNLHFKMELKEFVMDNFPSTFTNMQAPKDFNGNGIEINENEPDGSFRYGWLLTREGDEYYNAGDLSRDFSVSVDRCTCKDVPPGYEVLHFNAPPSTFGITQEKSICPAGKKNTRDVESICKDCESGKFQPRQGQTFCYDCDEATDDVFGFMGTTETINQDKQGSCTKYPGAIHPRECSFCEIGYYCADEEDGKCKLIETPSGGITALEHNCIQCSNDQTTPDIGAYTMCEGKCEKGEIIDENDECKACNLGQCADKTVKQCRRCPPGTKAETLMDCTLDAINELQCEACDFGKYQSLHEQQDCVDCPAGTYSNKSTCWNHITTLELEDYKEDTRSCDVNLKECDTYKCRESRASCETCPLGSYSDDEGSTSCTSCEPGKTSNNNDKTWNDGELQLLNQASFPTACVLCPAGTKSIAGDCIECEENHVSGDGAEICSACPAGKTNNAEHTECVECSEYFLRSTELLNFEHDFQDGHGCLGCYDVKGGNYVIDISPRLVPDNATCKRCESGYYNKVSDAEACKACPPCPEQFYRTGCGVRENTDTGHCVACDKCSDDEIRIDCKNRQGHNDETGHCAKKKVLTRTPECPRMNANTFTWQTIGLGGYGYTDVFGVNENQTDFQCRQPCDSTTAVVNVKDVSGKMPYLYNESNYGVVDSGYCTEAYACNTVSCLTETENRQVMACPEKIEKDDDVVDILRKRDDYACVSCESCEGRGCVDCAQLMCDNEEVWDWTEEDLAFRCKTCSALRNTDLCLNSDLHDFKEEHWPSGNIPVVRFAGCVGKKQKSLKDMTYGRCEKIEDKLTQTCLPEPEQFYSRSEGRCVPCLPRNAHMKEFAYPDNKGEFHQTYCQITGCNNPDVTGVSKWGMLCAEECSKERICQDTEQLVSCVVPHDSRCVSTHMPGNHRVGVSNSKRDFVPVHANFLEPIRVDGDIDFYLSSSFENHLITLDEYAENEFQCVWNARNIQDLNEIPGGNSRTFLAKNDVTSFDRYDTEGTKKCRQWPAKGPYPLLPLQNSVRDVNFKHGLFLLNSSASVMSYRFEDEDVISTLEEKKKKFSAHRLTGDLFLNIDMNGESQVNFMSFARPTNDSWVDKWEVSLLARDSSEPFHGDFLLQISMPTPKGDAIRAVQPQLLRALNPTMPNMYISRLFCKTSDAELCFQHHDYPDFSGTETSLKFFYLLQDRHYLVLQEYSAPSEQNFATCDIDMKLFKHSSLEHLDSRTSKVAKRNIATTATSNVLVGLVSDVHDFAACTANDVTVQCFRACGDGEEYEWTEDNAVIMDLSSTAEYLLVSTIDLNRNEYGYYLIDVSTRTQNSLGLTPNFKVFLSGTDSVWLLLRDFDTTEMSLQQFELIASEGDVQVFSTDNVLNLDWSVADTKFLSARSTLISQRDGTWLVMAPYSVDQEFEARLSIRVHRQDKPLLKQDYSLEQGNSWNFVNIQESQSYLSHAWMHDGKVAVGYDEQVFILEFDFDKEKISLEMASESNLRRHHFVRFRDGLITQEFVSSALSSQSVQNCYMGYVRPDSDRYKQIGSDIELEEHHCYHTCDATESCDGIDVSESNNSTFCALYEFQSQVNYTGDIPLCIRDATYLRRYTLEFQQTQEEFKTYVNVYSSKAAKSSGVFITSILHAAADLSSRGSGIDGYFAYDLKVFTDGDSLDDVQVDHGKDFTTTKTLLTQYFPSVNTVNAQFKALPHFPYVHSEVDSDEVGLLSYTTPSHKTQEFQEDLFLEIHVNTVEQDPWLAIIRLNCTVDARVYVQKSVFESMAGCTSDYAYLIVYYKESTLMFGYHNVQAFDARKRITHTEDYALVLLNFRTSLVFLQRMPHVPAVVFKDPEMFLAKQAKATSLQQDWQILRRTTSVKPENVSVSLFNSQRREGSVAIDNMQVVPLLNVGIKSFEQIDDTRIQETEFYIPSHSELSELALESVVTGNDLENWERMHVNFRVQTDTPECEVEIRVLHVAHDAEYHIGCKATADAHNETMCSVEVPTYFAENQDKQLPYVRTSAECEMEAVTVFFNPLSPMSTCPNLNQYYDYNRDLCVGCEYRVKNCPLGMFMPGCDAFGHTAECQNCSGGLGINEEFVQGDLVCQRRCTAEHYRFEGECVPCDETLKNNCNATHRWQACTETENEKCVECDPIIKSVFGGNEEFVESEQECVTHCKEGHWRDLSEPPFFCRPCRTTEEVLNGRDISEFRIQNCTAFSDTLAVGCTEEDAYDETCGLPSSLLHHDACGICGGDNSTCMDCNGVIDGSSKEDNCGVCDGENQCVDCNGVPRGGDVEDACGECGGDNTTCMDKCGVINGDNSCLVEYVDECGEPNGDNSTCLGCDGSFQIPVIEIQCHKCGVATTASCECDHGLCGEPTSLFTNCPKYTECSTASCTRLQECTACKLNEIYDTGTNECVLCQAGKFGNDATCTECAAGKFSQEGAFECIDCPANSNENTGKTECFCNSGYHLTDAGCELCSAGKHSTWDGIEHTLCIECVANHYCKGDGHERPCQGNMQSDPGSISVNNCNCLEGHGWYDDVESCQQCKRGWYSETVSRTPCDQCPEDRPYSDVVGSTTSTQCRACHVGAYHKDFNVGDNVQIDFDIACGHCELGKFLIESYQNEFVDDSEVNTICQECNPGTMNSIIDDHDYPGITIYNQTCLPCPAGTHKHDDSEDYSHTESDHILHDSNCYLCFQHYYTPAAGQIRCTACPPHSGNDHTIEHMDSKDHCKCNAGYEMGEVDAEDDAYCEQCTAGKKKTGHDWIDMTEEGCTFCDNGKTNIDDFTECRNCVSGEYSKDDGICKPCGDRQTSGAGESSCKCNAGYTGADGDASASSGCSQCPAGYYKTQPGSAACELCDFGKFSNTPAASSATVCKNCVAGTYLNFLGGTSCKNCPSNSDSPIAAQSCACNPGFFGNWESCQACVAGKYKMNAGSEGCTECGAGKFSSAQAATSDTVCQQCSAGKWSDTLGASSVATCIACERGKWSDASPATTINTCTACQAGKYSAVLGADTINTCTNCPAGKYSASTALTACALCEGGKYQTAEGRTKCEQCSSGKFSGRLTTGLGPGSRNTECTEQNPCTMCQADCDKFEDCMEGLQCHERNGGAVDPVGQCGGSAYNNGHDYCYDDTFTGISTYQCSSCADGHISPTGATSCTDCGVGKQPNGDRSACEDCEKGKFATQAHTSCEACAVGKYAASTGLSVCTDCTAGKVNSQTGSTDASACSACSAGQYSDAGAAQCESCPSNTWSALPAASTCDSCVQGYEIRSGCEKCNAGSFQPSNGGTQCTPCPVDEYQDSEGAASCIQCSTLGSNFVTSGTGNSECGCNFGYFFTDNGGSLSCTECPYATYKDTIDRAMDCVSCHVSTNTSARGKISITHCNTCALGYENYGAVNTDQCTQCNAGYAKGSSNTGSCVECSQTTYANVAGLTTCKDCPPDSTSTTGSGCSCNAGFGMSFDNSHELLMKCEQCDEGKYNGFVGATCQPCTADSSSPAGSTSEDDCVCNNGYEPNIVNMQTVLKCEGQVQPGSDISNCFTSAPGGSGLITQPVNFEGGIISTAHPYSKYTDTVWYITSPAPIVIDFGDTFQVKNEWVGGDYVDIWCAFAQNPRSSPLKMDRCNCMPQSADCRWKCPTQYTCSEADDQGYYMKILFHSDDDTNVDYGFDASFWSGSPDGSCAACAVGKFGVGAVCSDCQDGRYQPSTGLSVCDICHDSDNALNRAVNDAKTDCGCAAGWVRSQATGMEDFSLQCTQCANGKYKESWSSVTSTCTSCPTGSTTPNKGSVSIDACVCAAGYQPERVDTTLACPKMPSWSDWQDEQLEPCNGKASTTTEDGVLLSNFNDHWNYEHNLEIDWVITSTAPIFIDFVNMYFWDDSDYVEIWCADSMLQTCSNYGGTCTEECTTVDPNGDYKMEVRFRTNANGNTNGFEARFYSVITNGCEACTGGKFKAVAGDDTCTNCAVGKMSTNANAATSCFDCPDISVHYEDGRPCVCPAGYYGLVASDTSVCNQCSSGKYSNLGALFSTDCMWCGAGQEANIEQNACENCGKGKYSDGDNACANCELGKYNPLLEIECSSGCEYYAYGGTKTVQICNARSFSENSFGTEAATTQDYESGHIGNDRWNHADGHDCTITLKSASTITVTFAEWSNPSWDCSVSSSAYCVTQTLEYSYGGAFTTTTNPSTLTCTTGLLVMRTFASTNLHGRLKYNWAVSGTTSCLDCVHSTAKPGSPSCAPLP